MLGLPNILLIDNNPVSEKLLEKTFESAANLNIVSNLQQAAETIACDTVDVILVNADLYSVNAATTCAWLKGDPSSNPIKLIVLTQHLDSQKELKYYEAGADDVIALCSNQALIKHKVLRHTANSLDNTSLVKASNILNTFFEKTYTSDSLSDCMSECLVALQAMELKAALHVCDHPELTCSSFGYVTDYEKALMSYAECIEPSPDSARFTHGDENMSILVQNLPNRHHPHYASLVDWVKKIFNAISQKAKKILTATQAPSPTHQQSNEVNIPQTTSGAQRLHYFLEKALSEMESSCEQEINRSIGRIDEFATWPTLSPLQRRHVFKLKDNLLQLKETLMTNCLEIESRYLQFVTERRAKTRLNLGW
ncbi:MAG TPA: response regulator [Marinagarivorans sp.]